MCRCVRGLGAQVRVLPPPPPEWRVRAVSCVDVCVRIGCVHPRVCVAGCARSVSICVCVSGGLYVSKVCVCASMSGSRREGAAGAQRLVGPLCGSGEGSLPLPLGPCQLWGSLAVLGGDGHVFPFLVAG